MESKNIENDEKFHQDKKNYKYISDESSDNEDDDQNCNYKDIIKSKLLNNGRRGTVMSAPLKYDYEWSPPIFYKSSEEKELIKDIISQNVLFSTLDEKLLNIVVNAMQKVSFRENETIMKQNDEGDLFYVVNEGICNVYVNKKNVLKIEGGTKRNYFGELSLLYDAPRAATIISETYVTGWTLDRISFKKILMDTTIKKRNKLLEFINKVKLFESLSDNDRKVIADALKSEKYKSNEIILNEDDIGDQFYIIEKGQVECSKKNSEKIKKLERGEYFGELSLLNNEKRQATVTAITDTKLLSLDSGTFNRLMGPLENILRKNCETY